MNDSSSADGKPGRESLEESAAVGTTIVGPRPTAYGHGHVETPRGIEVLVKKASVDPVFRRTLMDRRAQSAQEIDLELSAAETVMLNSVPRAQIEQIIQNTSVPDEHRRVFLGRIGAAMLAIVGIGAAGCSRVVRQGSSPDLPLGPFQGSRPDDPGAQPKRHSRHRSDDEILKDRSNDIGADRRKE